MSIEEMIENLSQEVEGEKGIEENILIFTLSTCMWCKKCKSFLNERKMKYRYIELDKIDPKDKAKIALFREEYDISLEVWSRKKLKYLNLLDGNSYGKTN
ncbi:hypothetical protein LCGC14_2194980 [marine sediment metagenome]|uniref:Glutaredoxin domain-containing protein n=1 Tax=marine sediment metagenome TaxID=412755 RepID=A0A0F9GE72_9ZZZZ